MEFDVVILHTPMKSFSHPKNLVPGLLLLGLAGGCPQVEDGADVTLSFGHLPQAASAPCSNLPQDTAAYIDDVDALRLRVSGPGMKAMQKTYSKSAGELVMDKVPVGNNRSIQVAGLKTTLSLWRGQTRGVKVEASKASTVNVFLTRVADLTCARSPLQTGRAFHTATPLPDGRILLVGGISSETAASNCAPAGSNCRNLAATDTADIYDPRTGRVFAAGSLSRPRAFHAAAALADGRVVIVGGSGSGKLNTLAPFPVVPDSAIRDIEVYDPATNTFGVVGQDPEASGRTFAAGATVMAGLNKGAAVFAGGGAPALVTLPDPMTPSNNVVSSLRSSILCAAAGGTVECTAGPDMNARRAGHVMAPLTDGSLLVWGGNMENGTETGNNDNGEPRMIEKQAPEFFNGEAFVFPKNRPEFVEGGGRVTNTFFSAAVASPAWQGVFIVGGLIRNDDQQSLRLQDPEVAAQPSGQPAKGTVWFYDEIDHAVSDRLPVADAPKLELQSPRYLISAAALGEVGNFVAGGGIRGSLTVYEPSDAMDVFVSDDAKLKTINVGGAARPLRQRRAGLTATALPGGTALLVGGLSSDSNVADTAEIFTDTQEPL